MLTIPRSAVREFRALLRKCHTGRSRGPAPPVLLQADGQTIAMIADAGEVTLRWAMPYRESEGTFLLPMNALEAVEGGTEPVQFLAKSRNKALARWSDRGAAREIPVELLPPKLAPIPPALPEIWGEATPMLLAALHEAGRCAGRDPSRPALQRIQLRGTQGQILGTDGNQAVIQSGFAFPFTEALCIPAIPIFAAKEWEEPGRIGRTGTHLVVEIGPWTIWLTIDQTARYPDVEAAVPKGKRPTTITFSEPDATLLTDRLLRLPGCKEEGVPVTLDAEGGRIAIRAQGNDDTKPTEVVLTDSRFSGPAIRLAIDRRFFLKALALGCRTLRLIDSRPLVALAENTLYLAAVLDPSQCVGPLDTPAQALPPVHSPPETIMPKNPEPEIPNPDLLAEAEGLRLALLELAQRAGRLITLLKSRRKDERVLNQVWSSLKSLQLGGGPPR